MSTYGIKKSNIVKLMQYIKEKSKTKK